MKKAKEVVKLTSEQKLYKLANELYYRTKGSYVNGSQAMLGEYDEQGNRRTLAQVLKISKSYGITTFIELGLIETENGKKYTSSTNVRWIGEAPTKEISKTLSDWCKEYNRKKGEEAAFKLALKQEEAELKAKAEAEVAEVPVVETPIVETPVISKMDLIDILGDEKAPTNTPTVAPTVAPTQRDRQTALNLFIQVEIERNEILSEILKEFKKLNEAKIILGNEYAARG